MDTTLWINGQQNHQVQQNSQPQQFWSQAGCSNPQYSGVNDPQSAHFNPGYGAYCSGQTSNHQTSTNSQQLPTNTGYSHLLENVVHGNTNVHTSYNDAQTRNFNHQWQVSACQITTRQDPTSENWSNQRPPNMTAQTATFQQSQNMQYSVSFSGPVTLNYLQQSVATTVPQNAYKESNIAFKQDQHPRTSKLSWRKGTSQYATQSKKRCTTRWQEDGGKNPPPYTASTQLPSPPPYTASKTQMPPAKRSRSMDHDATFDSSQLPTTGQLPGFQTHLQFQSGVRKAPAFINTPVYWAPPSNNTQLSRENNGQFPQTSHLSVNPCSADSHPPPGYTSQKAVAVVQPLSQKSNQITPKKTCPEMIGQHQDASTSPHCVDEYKIHAEKSPNLLKLLIERGESEKKKNGICSDSDYDSDLKDQLNANVDPTDHGIVTTSHSTHNSTATLLSNGKQSEAHQSVTMEASQGREINKSDVQESELDNVGLLDLVPVITWTYEKLTYLIAMSSRAQIQPKHSEEVVKQLVKHLWDNNFRKLLSLVNTHYYNDLMAEVIKFCNDTHNSPILSQVRSKDWRKLKENFTVLDHDCVHFESPYVSPWLNVNEQLDDIDKEFGFPLSLKNCGSTYNTETEPMETNCGIPVDIVKELAIEKVPQMAPVLNVEDVVEDIESILPTKCSISMVPDDTLTADLKDPLDLLEIQILPPDQARIVFEQLKNESPVLEVKSNEVISTTEETTSMEEFCCINRWMEVISGAERLLECCCKSRLESNEPCVILLDRSEEENNIEVSSNCMQSNPSEISKIIDLSEEFEVPQNNLPITHHSTSMDQYGTEEEEIVNNILSNVNGESISKPALEEGCNIVEFKPACPAETLNIEPKQPQDHDDDHATAQSDEHCITEPSGDHMSAPEALLNIEQKQSNGDLHELKSISSSLTTGLTRLSPTVEPKDDYSSSLKKRLGASSKCKKTKGKKMQTNEDSVPSVSQPALRDTSNNIIKEKVDADDSTMTAKKTVKLALFGSLTHGNGVSVPQSPQCFSGRPHQPPSVLTLTRSPVKQRLCEEWRKSYLPITRKNKTIKDIRTKKYQNSTVTTVAPVEAKHVDMERLLVSPEQRYRIRSVKKRGRRKSTANDLTLETSKMSNKSVTKKRLLNIQSKSKSPKDPDMPLKENSVLRFEHIEVLLCNTFDFKDGPKSRNDKRDSVLDTSDCAAKDDMGLRTAVKKSRAGWARIQDKKHSLLSNFSPKNKTTFQKLQKKCMRKRWLAAGSCDSE